MVLFFKSYNMINYSLKIFSKLTKALTMIKYTEIILLKLNIYNNFL